MGADREVFRRRPRVLGVRARGEVVDGHLESGGHGGGDLGVVLLQAGAGGGQGSPGGEFGCQADDLEQVRYGGGRSWEAGADREHGVWADVGEQGADR